MSDRAKQLAEDHWAYIESLLAAHDTPLDIIDLCKFHYISAAIHFHGHGVEDANNVVYIEE